MSDGLYEPVTRQKTYQLVADIREALRMLESKAIIRSESNGGFAVAGFASTLSDSFDLLLSVDQADLRELFEDRQMIEGEAMEAGLGSERAFITADLRFHFVIAQASQNRHRRILEAIAAGDRGEARRQMHEHVSRVERRYRARP